MDDYKIPKTERPLYSLTVGEFIELNRHIYNEVQKRAVDNTSTNHDEFLSIDQASQFIHLAKSTIYSLTSKNLIPFLKKGKKIWFSKSLLSSWLNDGRQKTVAEMTEESKGFIRNKKGGDKK